MIRLRRIISGGQTGVDRGALEAAAYLGLDRGGFAPRGWIAEDGVIPEWYRAGMDQSPSPDYAVRTRANVEGSGGTLIFTRTLPLTGGTAHTRWLCKHFVKPLHIATLMDPLDQRFIRWLGSHNINTLNVAGSRESKELGIQKLSFEALIAVLGPELPTADAFGWDPPR
jgi:hypothetical protein